MRNIIYVSYHVSSRYPLYFANLHVHFSDFHVHQTKWHVLHYYISVYCLTLIDDVTVNEKGSDFVAFIIRPDNLSAVKLAGI